MKLNEYLPVPAAIKDIVDETPDTKTFILQIKGRSNRVFKYKPGQFLMISLPGYGEAPFTFASSPSKDGKFQISVRRVGFLTNAMHKLKEKDIIGVRGPYGNTFPLDKMEKKDLLFIAGGCGIAPLRPLIQHVFSTRGGKNRKDYGKVEIIYGCRMPKDRFYKKEIKEWMDEPDTKVYLTVDEPDQTWDGACGVVCVMFPRIKLNPKTSMVFLCGPSVMIKSAIRDILKLGFREQNIYASLERYMKCGIGKCGHCYIKGKYVCTDGPNFSYTQMKKLGITS
jgi:NAD(P)H-flavin reductase